MASSSSSRPRKRAPRKAAGDVPATADLTPPPVPEPEPAPADPVAPAPAGEPVGANLLRPGPGDVGLTGQQDERVALSIMRSVGDKELFDASTGESPDPDAMFAAVGHSGTTFECRIRLMERMWVNTHSTVERLVVPAGRQVSAGAAGQIRAAVEAQRARH